jgi:exopolyphosphatase/guanosine-5'-triphosphate,3'-diphosphate pyrophosphatase
VTLKEVRAVEELLFSASFKARLAIPGLDPKRVDTLLPATAVIRSLLELIEHEELTLSDKAIRDGLIYDFIERNHDELKAEQDIPNVRRRNVLYLARRCHYPESHSHHVAELVTSLFDQTQSLHNLGEQEREWLEYAAILHDVGYLINSRQHHKHAYYLIKNSDLSGLTADEIEMIANIARYHRRALPRSKHESLKTMPARNRKTLDILSALLRIADGLDRSHFSVIQSLEVTLGKPVTIRLRTSGDPELEVWAARTRADLFEKVFKLHVRLEVVPLQEKAG